MKCFTKMFNALANNSQTKSKYITSQRLIVISMLPEYPAENIPSVSNQSSFDITFPSMYIAYASALFLPSMESEAFQMIRLSVLTNYIIGDRLQIRRGLM